MSSVLFFSALFGCSSAKDEVDTPTTEGPCVPVAPCDIDLDVVCGSVEPDIGSISSSSEIISDPQEDGPFEVSQNTTSLSLNHEVSLTVFVPETSTPLPLVLILPRFTGSYTEYEHLTVHLASHGFVVIGADVSPGGFLDPAEHDKKADNVVSVIDWALQQEDLSAKIDASKIAVTGHSLGGKLAFYAAAIDKRIDVVIGWDPQNSGGPPCLLGQTTQGHCDDFPVAPNCLVEDSGLLHQMQAESIIFAAQDTLLTPDSHLWASEFYRGAPSPTHLISMPDVGHLAWSSEGDEALFSRGVHTAFLLQRFKGYTGLEEWLPDEDLSVEHPSFIDEIRSK